MGIEEHEWRTPERIRSLSLRLEDLRTEDVDSLILAFSRPQLRAATATVAVAVGTLDASLWSAEWRLTELSPIRVVFFLGPMVTIVFFFRRFWPKADVKLIRSPAFQTAIFELGQKNFQAYNLHWFWSKYWASK